MADSVSEGPRRRPPLPDLDRSPEPAIAAVERSGASGAVSSHAVAVHLDGHRVLYLDGEGAHLTRLTSGDHDRLVAALAQALQVAATNRPAPSALAEAVQAVEILTDILRSADAPIALGFIRAAIDDAREAFTHAPAAAPLN